MKCPACQSKNPEGARFCNQCGCNLTTVSETNALNLSFDEKLQRIQRYLPRGLTEKILAQKNKIEGERKQVTVMFCDISQFTVLVDILGPEEAYGFMDKIYEILIHRVHDLEGTVNEMTGDGIMALFGAPITLEDAPQRAIRSALSIHRELANLEQPRGASGPIQMRIGIHTGPVVVGSLGNDLRVEFKAVGNTVNLASRMERMAEAGSIYVTEQTFRLTKELFNYEAIGRRIVKGKAQPVSVYKVLSGKNDVYRPRLGSERVIYSEMIGRNQELDRLELQVLKVVNGEGSVVNIIGEAGIGKSRLLAELKKREVIRRLTLLEGRAISIGRNLSFHPIIDLLKHWARIRENDAESIAFNKLEAAIKSLNPENASEALPFVATLMGMKLPGRYAQRLKGIDGEALEKLIFKNIRELIIWATEQAPLVIVIEDLHWADTSSIVLMESLFRLAETHQVLFINLFRPGNKETGDRIVDTIKEKLSVYYVEITIDPLDKRMSEALITNMLKVSSTHNAFIHQITRRSGGNPFFIEEVVRSFIDEGALIRRDKKLQLADALHQIDIPHTINEVLMSRIDRLEEGTRNLVIVASVIGKNFLYPILLEIAKPIDDIDGKLSYLKEIQLIREHSRIGEVEFSFRHALAQEAIYASILPEKRMELHRRTAGAIEKIYHAKLHEFYGMLAYHYSKAEILAKAETYLFKAGEEALKSSASNEALHYYQQVLNLYLNKYADSVDSAKVAVLEKNIAIALYNRGQYNEAIQYFDKALIYFWGKLPKRAIPTTFKFVYAIMRVVAALYLPLLNFRKVPTQIDIEIFNLLYKKCKALAVIDPKRFFLESFYVSQNITRFDLQKFEVGLQIFMGISSLFSFTGLSFRLSRKILNFTKDKVDRNNVKSYIIYDLCETIQNYFAGDWKAIKNYDDDLVDESLRLGAIYDASQHLYWHGFAYIYCGSPKIAASIVDKLEEIFQVYQNEISISLKYELNTILLMEYCRLAEALDEARKGIDFAKKAGLNHFLIEMHSCKAWIHLTAGDSEEAEKCLIHATQYKGEIDLVPFQLSNYFRSQSRYYLCRLEEALQNGQKAEFAEYRQRASGALKRLSKTVRKVAQHRTEFYRLAGVYFWLTDKQRKALRAWHSAIAEGEKLDSRLQLARTYAEIGQRLAGMKQSAGIHDGSQPEAYLQKAREFFEAMDLQWDLDKINRTDEP